MFLQKAFGSGALLEARYSLCAKKGLRNANASFLFTGALL
jgi:hypothetical protein